MTVQRKKFKVLLVGDACWDVYLFVDNKRRNPETDAPLLVEREKMISGGMGANVFRCLEKLDLDVTCCLPTARGDKVRVLDIDTGKQYCRIDNEIKAEPFDIKKYPFVNDFDAVVISDYNKGYLDTDAILALRAATRMPVFLDTKKTNLGDFQQCIIKINFFEATQAEVVPMRTVVTNGANGAFWGLMDYPAFDVECVDVCGAGDAFLAGLVLGHLESGSSLEEAIPYGIVNSGISVSKRGTYAPSLSELKEGLVLYAKQNGPN